jgi:hypothetical protein
MIHKIETCFHILALSQEDRDAVQMMDVDAGVMDSEDVLVYNTIAPGDEGFDISHEGGEYEVYEDFADGITKLNGL